MLGWVPTLVFRYAALALLCGPCRGRFGIPPWVRPALAAALAVNELFGAELMAKSTPQRGRAPGRPK